MYADVQYGPPREYLFFLVDMGEPVCGEDFCDGCGDCLACQYHDEEEWCRGYASRWVIYHDDPKHPSKLPPTDPRWQRYDDELRVRGYE